MIEGFRHFGGYFDAAAQARILDDVRRVIAAAPLFKPKMRRSGRPFSVQMTNAGPLGWVSDKERGYRYQDCHPVTGARWPGIPESLLGLWDALAEWPNPPEACLVNYFAAGAKMGSHVDRDEQELEAPVVSVSLGDTGVFHVGGLRRGDKKTRISLSSGDVAVLGGPARRAYHGIDRVIAGSSDLLAEGGRFNLTLRRVSPRGCVGTG